MKWPNSLTLIRHDTSAYNVLKAKKMEDPLYVKFQKEYEKDITSEATKKLALEVAEKYTLVSGDHDTPLADGAGWQAETVGKKLHTLIDLPDVIYVSPFLRTHITLDNIMKGWPELRNVKVIEEERLREHDHGLVQLYNDWLVFTALHPEQVEMRNRQTQYWYRYPQGENVPDVRERIRSWSGAIIRDHKEKNVLVITHHLSILAFRANFERLDAGGFLRLDRDDKPINCGVTIYRGNPNEGTDGKLILEKYNVNLYAPK